MRFEVGAEAAALRDAAAQVLAGQAPVAVLRAGWPGGDPGAPAAAWRRVADTGAVGALVPVAAGGLGLDENAVVPLLEALGYNGLPVPAVETIAIGAPLLAIAGSDRLQGVLGGDCQVAAQLGDSDLLPFGQRAELVILRQQDTLRVYERTDLELTPCVTVDGSRALARIGQLRRGGSTLAATPGVVASAWWRGVLGTSALLVGLAARMLELTVGYVRQREQFGAPVGSFQAIKHALASALVAVEFARPAVLAAGWAQAARVPDAARQTSAAKVLASDAARLVARTAIQCHGAMGYTTEYDLHLFAKRVWALAPSWGDPAWHRARIAESLGV